MAHLLEHLVFKGTPKHTNIPQELTAHGARPNGTTWFDRTNYFETFDATDVNLEWALDLESRPDGELVHREEGPRQRDDGRAERVRGGRERPGRSSHRARLLDGVPLARLRPGHDRGALGPRERADRPAAGVLPDVLPARQRRSRRRGKVRRGQDARARPEALRLDPEARADPLPHLHARPRAGRRAHRHAPARRRRADRGRRVPHSSRRRSGRAGPRPPRLRARRHAVRAPPQGARRDEEGVVGLRLFAPREGAGAPPLRRRGPAGPVPRRGEGPPPEDRRGRRVASADEGGGRARTHAAPQADRPRPQRRLADRAQALELDREGRLAALLPVPRPAEGLPGGRSREGRRGVPEALEPHARDVHSDGEAGPRGRTSAARRRGDAQGLHGRGRRRGRRGVRPVARERRGADEALRRSRPG